MAFKQTARREEPNDIDWDAMEAAAAKLRTCRIAKVRVLVVRGSRLWRVAVLGATFACVLAVVFCRSSMCATMYMD